MLRLGTGVGCLDIRTLLCTLSDGEVDSSVNSCGIIFGPCRRPACTACLETMRSSGWLDVGFYSEEDVTSRLAVCSFLEARVCPPF